MTGQEGRSFSLPPASALLAIHDRLIDLYGGARGIRDPDALDAALARPRNLRAYGGEATVPQLAVALAFGICRIRHPFVDGNKRAAFAALVVTLGMNGLALDAPEAEATRIMVDVASGNISEEGFAAWVASHTA